MKKSSFIIGAAALLSIVGPGVGSALASGNGKPQTEATVGNCMSDGLYGNEPNMADGTPGGPAEQEPGTKGGNVLPTQSPGPWVNNPTDPENPTRGRSAGQWNQNGVNIPEICRTIIGQ